MAKVFSPDPEGSCICNILGGAPPIRAKKSGEVVKRSEILRDPGRRPAIPPERERIGKRLGRSSSDPKRARHPTPATTPVPGHHHILIVDLGPLIYWRGDLRLWHISGGSAPGGRPFSVYRPSDHEHIRLSFPSPISFPILFSPAGSARNEEPACPAQADQPGMAICADRFVYPIRSIGYRRENPPLGVSSVTTR